MTQSKNVTDQLRQAIVDSGKTLGAIADESGVDRGRLSRFMRAERTLTLSAVDDLCRCLGLDLQPIKKPRGNKGKKT